MLLKWLHKSLDKTGLGIKGEVYNTRSDVTHGSSVYTDLAEFKLNLDTAEECLLKMDAEAQGGA